MPDSVFTYRMPAGIPGEVSRAFPYGCTIQPQIQHPTTPVTQYGQVCLIDPAGIRPIAAGDTSAPAYGLGFSVRPYPSPDYSSIQPSYAGSANVGFGAGAPPAAGIVDQLRRGYMTVKCNVGTPAKGGAVYVYYGVSTGSHVQAGIEAGAGANLWAIPGAYFTGAQDANGNVEIEFKIN